MTGAAGQHPADSQPRRLRILRERLPDGHQAARRRCTRQVEREELQGSGDALPEARELREALAETLRRADREAQSCRDDLQHDRQGGGI